MNKNFNTVVELTEQELAYVTGGGLFVGGIIRGGKGVGVGADFIWKKRPPVTIGAPD